jgi:hypothetical protein
MEVVGGLKHRTVREKHGGGGRITTHNCQSEAWRWWEDYNTELSERSMEVVGGLQH